MTGLMQDLRYALRSFRNRPTFAVVAMLTIAIGIGANTTIFSWLRSLVLNPFPGTLEPERIVAIENTAPDGEPITTSYLDFRDFRNSLRLVKSVTAYRGYLFSVGEVPRSATMRRTPTLSSSSAMAIGSRTMGKIRPPSEARCGSIKLR